MIDIFALALTHGLMLLGLWRMLSREDLDGDGPTPRHPRESGGPSQSTAAKQTLGSRFRGNDKEGGPEADPHHA